MTRDELVAYGAGVLDGEGSICILEFAPKDSRPNGRFLLRVAVGMTDRGPVDAMYGIFGGNVRTIRTEKYTSRAYHVWELHGTGAAKALKEMRPYLRAKGEQADIAIRFQSHVDLWKARRAGHKYGTFELPPEVWKVRKAYKDKLQRLHARSRLAGATTESKGPEMASDSLTSGDGKPGEAGRNDQPRSEQSE